MTIIPRLRALVDAMPDAGAVTLPITELRAWLEAEPTTPTITDQGTAEQPTTTWRERLWTVPDQTRIGVVEVAEAFGRSKSWLYKRTQAMAEDPIPCRRLDGELVFVVAELRDWLCHREDIVHPGRTS